LSVKAKDFCKLKILSGVLPDFLFARCLTASGFLFAQRPEVLMQVRIARPVVISSTAGLRHLAPGLVVELTDAEAKQILRQEAGSVSRSELGEAAAKPPKSARANAREAKVTQAESPD
jgi:hypothetical protein